MTDVDIDKIIERQRYNILDIIVTASFLIYLSPNRGE